MVEDVIKYVIHVLVWSDRQCLMQEFYLPGLAEYKCYSPVTLYKRLQITGDIFRIKSKLCLFMSQRCKSTITHSLYFKSISVIYPIHLWGLVQTQEITLHSERFSKYFSVPSVVCPDCLLSHRLFILQNLPVMSQRRVRTNSFKAPVEKATDITAKLEEKSELVTVQAQAVFLQSKFTLAYLTNPN